MSSWPSLRKMRSARLSKAKLDWAETRTRAPPSFSRYCRIARATVSVFPVPGGP